MPVSMEDLLLALEYASASGAIRGEAFVCKQSGKTYLRSDDYSDDDLPDDIDDEEKYLKIPDKRQLDLSKALVMRFAREVLPDDFSEVREIFSHGGAYAGFKRLLARRRAVDQWYAFETKATEEELRAWCELNSIEVAD